MIILNKSQISDLRSSIKSISECVSELVGLHSQRSLVGENSLLLRTLGDNFVGPLKFEKTYLDTNRGETLTEFAESMKQLVIFDDDPREEHAIELLLEVGDVLFQKQIVLELHKNHKSFDYVISRINIALNFLKSELEKRKFSLDLVQKMTEVKYSSRNWHSKKGFSAKNKKLEYMLCIAIFKEYVQKHHLNF